MLTFEFNIYIGTLIFFFIFQIFRFPRTRSVRFFANFRGKFGYRRREGTRSVPFEGNLLAPKARRNAKRPVWGEIWAPKTRSVPLEGKFWDVPSRPFFRRPVLALKKKHYQETILKSYDRLIIGRSSKERLVTSDFSEKNATGKILKYVFSLRFAKVKGSFRTERTSKSRRDFVKKKGLELLVSS